MKKVIVYLLVLVMLVALAGCGNRDMIDTVHKYDRAIIYLPDGTVVSGKVQSWKDYEDGDQLQIKIEDVTYLVHSTNAVLIAE